MLPPDGLRVLRFEDVNLQIGFYVREQVPKLFASAFIRSAPAGPLQLGRLELAE
jgi:hypothetical protein